MREKVTTVAGALRMVYCSTDGAVASNDSVFLESTSPAQAGWPGKDNYAHIKKSN